MAPVGERRASMAKELILVGDDDRVVVELLSLWLRSHGFVAKAAADGMQVIMAAHRSPPAAIILDIMMPGGTGFDVLKRLRANAAMSTVPVLAMSATADPALPGKARDLGADAFLLKPVREDEVVATLRRLLAQRAAAQAEADSRDS